MCLTTYYINVRIIASKFNGKTEDVHNFEHQLVGAVNVSSVQKEWNRWFMSLVFWKSNFYIASLKFLYIYIISFFNAIYGSKRNFT